MIREDPLDEVLSDYRIAQPSLFLDGSKAESLRKLAGEDPARGARGTPVPSKSFTRNTPQLGEFFLAINPSRSFSVSVARRP